MPQPNSVHYRYYIKRLNSQELGYRKGILSTGAYWYVSKKAAAHFFPRLDKLIHNDSSNIHLFIYNSRTRANITYVYHNDRHSVRFGTRDEYRIYLNRKVSPSKFTYGPGDILIFNRFGSKDYRLFHISTIDPLYKKINIFLEDLGGHHSHFLMDRLPDFMISHLDWPD
jgi:hypothetical protein